MGEVPERGVGPCAEAIEHLTIAHWELIGVGEAGETACYRCSRLPVTVLSEFGGLRFPLAGVLLAVRW